MPCSPRARVAGLLTAALGVLLLAGCEDPSAVGLTILDPGDTDPRTQAVPAQAEIGALEDFTGFLPPATGTLTARVLAGRVEDPLFGSLRAAGYVNFGRPTLPPAYTTTPLEAATLRLRPDYRYGEAETPTTFDLYEIEAGWNPTAFASDTTLPVRPRLLASFTVAPADTLVEVPLPADWVAERDTTLRGVSFPALFHGFEIRPRPEGRLAVGFDGQRTSLLTFSDYTGDAQRDTVAFPAVAVFTGVERQRPPAAALPEGFLPLQDGASEGLRLTFRLDDLGGPAISAGLLRIEADTTLLTAQAPPGFVRPLARTLTLYGLGAGAPQPIADATLDPRKQAYTFSSTLLTVLIQDALLGRPRFQEYAIGFPRSPSTLSVAPLVSRPGAPPRVVLVVVPSD